MYYVIQQNLFKEPNFYALLDILNRHKLEYEVIKWRPFTDEVELLTDRKDIVCFGGVSLCRAAQKYGWVPGVFFNDSHDMEVYMKVYGDHMLNNNGTCINYGDDLPDYLDEYFFARPTRDTKVFSGAVFSRESWEQWFKAELDPTVETNLKSDTRIFVANTRPIEREIRCWVVDGKVVTISLYKLGKKGFQQNYDYEQEAIDFAQRMVDIHSPSRAFVLDICLSDGEYKIVEINCINSAGFYDANMSKLIQAIEVMDY
jgi:hypothetical protein